MITFICDISKDGHLCLANGEYVMSVWTAKECGIRKPGMLRVAKKPFPGCRKLDWANFGMPAFMKAVGVERKRQYWRYDVGIFLPYTMDVARMIGPAGTKLPTVVNKNPYYQGMGFLFGPKETIRLGIKKDGTLRIAKFPFLGSQRYIQSNSTMSTMDKVFEALGAQKCIYVEVIS